MALKVIHHNHRNVKREGESLCKGRSNQKGTQQSGAARKSDSRKVFLVYSGTLKRL